MAQFLRPISAGLPEGATGSYDSVDEVIPDDEDFIDTGSPGGELQLLLSTPNKPINNNDHIIRFRVKRHSLNILPIPFTLKENKNNISSGSIYPSTTAYTTYSSSLTTREAAKISDYSTLNFHIGGEGSAYRIYLSWMEMEIPDSKRRIFNIS